MSSSLNNPSKAFYPSTQVLLGTEFNTSTQGTWTKSTAAASLYNCLLSNSTNAVNDQCDIPYKGVNTGTYTLLIRYSSGSTCAKCHILIDTVDVGNVDTYAASGLNNQVGSIASVAIVSGTHTISIKASDRHASSTGYTLQIDSITLIRTA
jgi:hypothetical protein